MSQTLSQKKFSARRNSLIQIAVTALCAASLGKAQARIYKWTDSNGKVHFSDRPSIQHRSKTVDIKINSYKSVSHDRTTIDTGKSVIMYSASWCGVCKKARRYFKKNGISFTEYDIEKSRKGRYEFPRLKARGVPVILIGKKRMNGFSAAGFERIYPSSAQDAAK